MIQKIVLTVSKGATYLVPDFTDGTYVDAEYELEKNCPNVNIVVEYMGKKRFGSGYCVETKRV